MEPGVVWEVAEGIPPDWYGCELEALEKLVRELIGRRGLVRGLIELFRISPRRPFEGWMEH
jgi:hypothetical protein